MRYQVTVPRRTLPERPSLDQLRKQAKDLQRRYLAGEADAASEVANSDFTAPSKFLLADAQRVLARSYGFGSWSQLKRRVDGLSIARFCEAARVGDLHRLRSMLRTRPELPHLDLAETDEHRAIHFAVLNRHPAAVQLLMDAGSDANKGIYPNRNETTAVCIAADRSYDEIVAIIHDVEQARREGARRSNAVEASVQEQIRSFLRAGKIDEAIGYLERNLSQVNSYDHKGESPLHVASSSLNEVMVSWLVRHGASTILTDVAGFTPLDRAVFAVDPRDNSSLERFSAVAKLLFKNVEPVSLAAAVALGHLDRVKTLHQTGEKSAESNTMPVGPLSIAVRHRQRSMVNLLLDLGYDPDERVRLKHLEGHVYSAGMPLWYAVVGDDFETAKLLLERGASPNAEAYASGTPTSQAFSMRNRRLETLLTDFGGYLSAESVGLYRKTENARQMLSRPADFNIVANSYSGPTLPEQLLWGGACGGDPEIVRLALQQIDWPPEDPRWFRMAVQPLRIWNEGPGHWTGGYDRSTYPDCFKQIVSRCDVNVVGRHGATLLHRIASDGTCWGQEVMTSEERQTFATIILDAGAHFNVRDLILESTPLGWAVRFDRPELVELYLSRGVAPEEPDAAPWATPMAWATRYHLEHIKLLLEQATT